ncbi:MAG: tRNA dihydrouridine synthase DusB [Gemmiger sp.]|uniref:tRNA dihydrouridine synthase DusB n=1 Tax=Gemmiger sp. TaxID=2049027 RepID=UPI002E7725CA|nr:tRNA dihydrouridine synthase DusB [Gemmiger sp.]MEE0800788.1 tRNA dihydrouridine synthase DusB [Gemmiger sp.]
MQLRSLTLPDHPAVFAPMAGLSDAACRHLMADHGAAWTVSEMASAKAITFGDKKSIALLRDAHPHGVYAVQLFGAEPETVAQAIGIIRDKGVAFDILDLNMGCPAPKITSGGAGSRLLLDPALCGRMVAAARQALGPDTPLTVKMRIGWDGDHLTGVEVARECERAGADLLAVHGRTREQMYIPPIDPAAIAAIRQAVQIPVLANGDITSAAGAARLLEQTGCAGVMIGRGALGDPWLFERVNAVLAGQPEPPLPSLNRRMAALRAQVYEMCEEKGEWTAMPQARSQAMYYMKGLKGAASLRRYCSMLEHFPDVDRLIDTACRLQD